LQNGFAALHPCKDVILLLSPSLTLALKKSQILFRVIIGFIYNLMVIESLLDLKGTILPFTAEVKVQGAPYGNI
jgi:hypothetical protein